MKDYTLKNGKTVKLPSTWQDWQLYDQARKNAAAVKLTMKLEEIVLKLEEAHASPQGFGDKYVDRLYQELLVPEMKAWSNLGAMDTEPRGAALHTLERVLLALTGNTVYLDGW